MSLENENKVCIEEINKLDLAQIKADEEKEKRRHQVELIEKRMELEDKKAAAQSSVQAKKSKYLKEQERVKTNAIKERKEHQAKMQKKKMERELEEKERRQNQAYNNLQTGRQNAMAMMGNGMAGNGMNNFPMFAQNPMMNMMSGMMNMMGMMNTMSGGSNACDPFQTIHLNFKNRFNNSSDNTVSVITSPTKEKEDDTFSNRDSIGIESVEE